MSDVFSEVATSCCLAVDDVDGCWLTVPCTVKTAAAAAAVFARAAISSVTEKQVGPGVL